MASAGIFRLMNAFLRRLGRLAIPLVAAASFAGPLRAQDSTSVRDADTTPVPPQVLSALRDTIAARYVAPVSRDSLQRFTTAQAMLASLRDRHTILFSPRDLAEFKVEAGQRFGGIGARLGQRRDTAFVTSVLPGSPAQRAGLAAFDRIVALDGRSVVGMPVDKVVEQIRGPVGSKLAMGVVRRGAKAAEPRALQRAEVQVPSVTASMVLDGGVGVVRLAQFGEGATGEVAHAIDGLLQAGATSLLLDLRGNPGGLLEEGLGVAQLFLPERSGLIEVRGRPGYPAQRASAGGPPRYPKLPLAVLVDQRSASAAEILAGALQDAKRARVFGSQSYGKGSVQEMVPLPEGWAVKLTIARWFTPKGRPIDRGVQPADSLIDLDAPHTGGITPDVVIPPDSANVPPVAAVTAIGVAGWRTLADRIMDWTERHADETAPVADSTELAHMLDSIPVPPETRPQVEAWLSRELTASALRARYGDAAEDGWRLSRDAQLAAARALMARQVRAQL
ncbi:MAG TPA: S41 family peptidase [Gemmatimonadales bacterium]|nr:S41 family peptidase [Gemmatimonadales bacterium]